MRDIFVISDTHFNHANILSFEEDGNAVREFPSVGAMNEHMVERWNAVVKPGDKVYHLGDVFFGNRTEADGLLSRLNGQKRLVLGNHDDGRCKVLQAHFKRILSWRMLDGLLFTHVPVHPDTLLEGRFKGYESATNVHGHLHARMVGDPRYVCVSVEAVDYTPVNIEELRR